MTFTNDTNLLLGRIEDAANGAFKADQRIVSSVSSAKAIYEKLRNNSLKRIKLYAEIEGLLQGNPPYNPQQLAAANLAHIANFNDMSAHAIYERACLAYWNLLHSSESLIDISVRTQDPEGLNVSRILSRNWDYAVRSEWPSFLTNVATLSSQLVKFGISPAIFHDEIDPKWSVVECSKFLIPDQAQSDLDQLGTMLIETDFKLSYLWSVYQEVKNRTDTPWSAEELGRLLVYITAGMQGDSANIARDSLEVQRRLQAGDISFDRLYDDTVRLVSLFQREYDGRISRYIFHRHYDAGDFLYQQQEQYDKMSDALILFTMNPGEYTIHSNRGLGHKIYSLAQAKIMMDCSVVDMAKWASTPIIKSSSLNSRDAEQIRFYPGVPTNIGSAEFVQNNLGANVQNVMGAAQYLSNLIQFNISYAGGDPAQPDPDQGSLNPTQTRLMAYREFSVLKNNIMHFYSTFDRVLGQMVARMLRCKEGQPGYDMAKVWKERSIEDGVPSELFDMAKEQGDRWKLPAIFDVRATRVAGAGSQVAHLIGLQELQAIAGDFGPRESREYKRQWITATLGAEAVPAFLQEGDDVDERAGGASLAGVENAIMQSGKSPVFSPDNEHKSHIATHLALAMAIIQQFQQQQLDAVEADAVLTVLVPHVSEHFGAIANSIFAQSFVAKHEANFKQIASFAIVIKKAAANMAQAKIRQQQQGQLAQQQVMNEEQLKNLQVMNDEQRKNLKLKAQMDRQQAAGETKAEMLRRRVEGELEIKRMQAQGEADINATMEQDAGQIAKAAFEESPSEYLRKLNGDTPAPYDIEGYVFPNKR